MKVKFKFYCAGKAVGETRRSFEIDYLQANSLTNYILDSFNASGTKLIADKVEYYQDTFRDVSLKITEIYKIKFVYFN